MVQILEFLFIIRGDAIAASGHCTRTRIFYLFPWARLIFITVAMRNDPYNVNVIVVKLIIVTYEAGMEQRGDSVS